MTGVPPLAWQGSLLDKPAGGDLSFARLVRHRLDERSWLDEVPGWLPDRDLLVMGGACQHDFQHSVPKAARAGARMCVTLRHSRDGGWVGR